MSIGQEKGDFTIEKLKGNNYQWWYNESDEQCTTDKKANV